jgi:putative transposase
MGKSPGDRSYVDPERRAVAVMVLAAQKARGTLTTTAVDAVAVELGVTRRTVWRWLAGVRTAAEPARKARQRFEVTDEDICDLAYWYGNMNAAYRARSASLSEATLRRAFHRALTPGQAAGLRGGERVRRNFDTYLTRFPHHRNECWEADHCQFAVEVLLPDGRVITPWLTVFVETFSRAVCGWAICEHANRESVFAALTAGILTGKPYGPVGGVPERLRWDRGREFLSEAITDAAKSLAIDARAVRAYTPHLKGAVERLHESIEGMFLAELPGFQHGPRERNGHRVDEDAPLLTIDHFVDLFAAFVGRYNTSHQHGGLDGETPIERWNSDATPITEVPVEHLRHLMLARADRTVYKRGIRLDNHVYNSADLVGWVGESVEVRYMPHRFERVEVFHGDRHLATAWPVDAMEEAEVQRILVRRAEAARWLSRQHRAAARRRREHFAPLTADRSGSPPMSGRPQASLKPSRSLVIHREIPGHMVRPLSGEKRSDPDSTSEEH